MDATLHIKNLSIALEALSRVNSIRSQEFFKDIEGLLAIEIFVFRKEKEKETQWPPRAWPAPTATEDESGFNPFTKA